MIFVKRNSSEPGLQWQAPHNQGGGRKRDNVAPREPNGRIQRVGPRVVNGEAYVYVMCLPDHGGVKIGYSNNPAKRLAQIQNGNSSIVKLFWQLKLSNVNARILEKVVHSRLRNMTAYHRQGEWYDIDPLTAVNFIRNTARDLTRPKSVG